MPSDHLTERLIEEREGKLFRNFLSCSALLRKKYKDTLQAQYTKFQNAPFITRKMLATLDGHVRTIITISQREDIVTNFAIFFMGLQDKKTLDVDVVERTITLYNCYRLFNKNNNLLDLFKELAKQYRAHSEKEVNEKSYVNKRRVFHEDLGKLKKTILDMDGSGLKTLADNFIQVLDFFSKNAFKHLGNYTEESIGKLGSAIRLLISSCSKDVNPEEVSEKVENAYEEIVSSLKDAIFKQTDEWFFPKSKFEIDEEEVLTILGGEISWKTLPIRIKELEEKHKDTILGEIKRLLSEYERLAASLESNLLSSLIDFHKNQGDKSEARNGKDSKVIDSSSLNEVFYQIFEKANGDICRQLFPLLEKSFPIKWVSNRIYENNKNSTCEMDQVIVYVKEEMVPIFKFICSSRNDDEKEQLNEFIVKVFDKLNLEDFSDKISREEFKAREVLTKLLEACYPDTYSDIQSNDEVNEVLKRFESDSLGHYALDAIANIIRQYNLGNVKIKDSRQRSHSLSDGKHLMKKVTGSARNALSRSKDKLPELPMFDARTFLGKKSTKTTVSDSAQKSGDKAFLKKG